MDDNIAVSDEIEAAAKKRGWIPKDKWDGDENNHVDAKTFMQVKDTRITSLRERAEEAVRQRKAMEETLAETKATAASFRKHMEDLRVREKEKYEEEIGKLKALRAEAVSTADTNEFERVEAQIEKLKERAGKEERVGMPPELEDFHRRNPWAKADEKLGAVANVFFSALNSSGRLGVSESLAATEEHIKRLYPEKFENPNRDKAPPVDRGSSEVGASGGARSYASLPASAKSACDRFVKTIPGFTVKKYIDTYDWSGV